MVNNELLRVGQLAADIAPDEKAVPFSAEAWLYALEMTLLGMGMIFVVLAILWGVLAIFKLVFARPAKETKAKKEAPAATEAPKVEVASAPVTASTDDAELVAILTAAIVAYESQNNPDVTPANFRVVSFRRTNGGRSWNAK